MQSRAIALWAWFRHRDLHIVLSVWCVALVTLTLFGGQLISLPLVSTPAPASLVVLWVSLVVVIGPLEDRLTALSQSFARRLEERVLTLAVVATMSGAIIGVLGTVEQPYPSPPLAAALFILAAAVSFVLRSFSSIGSTLVYFAVVLTDVNVPSMPFTTAATAVGWVGMAVLGSLIGAWFVFSPSGTG